ncbi:MAG: short-chain dehydrogenase [Gammaproteobacteria bacterium]|nr:short-chain dehydrogenase [Gammaproteobacteria bacterium]
MNQENIVVITGGASGIGLSSTNRFLKEGYEVIIIDIDKKAGKKLEKDLKSKGYTLIFKHCNISSYQQVKEVFKSLKNDNKTPNVLVNSAGISPGLNMLHKYPVDEWHKAIEINLNGTFYSCREFLKLAINKKIKSGAIVNVASIMGVRASGAQASYAASKHAVVGLTKSIGIEYAPLNIRANAVGPGVIDTPMNTELMKDKKIMQFLLSRIPNNRVATPDEVANLIFFLASPEASYITGSYYPVDGGYLAT